MSDHGKVHLFELSAISLEGVEKTMDAFGRVVHALHVVAHYIPPFALLLETIAGVFEVKGDLKKAHLKTVDKGAQILALSILISIVAVGFAAFGFAVLAPAMPFVYAAAAGVLALATTHRFFLVKKDPEYKRLLGIKVELEKDFGAILKNPHLGPELKQDIQKLMIDDKNVTYVKKKEKFYNKYGDLMVPATANALATYLEKFESFSQGRENYAKFQHELSHIKIKTMMHSIFFVGGITFAALLFAGVAIATTIIPAILATVVVGYVAYRTSPITKIKQFFSQKNPKQQPTVYQSREEIMRDLKNSNEKISDLGAHADLVLNLKDSRKLKYKKLVSETGSHQIALEKVYAFKNLAESSGPQSPFISNKFEHLDSSKGRAKAKEDPEFKRLLTAKVKLEKEFVTILNHKQLPLELKQALQKLMLQDKAITDTEEKQLLDMHPDPKAKMGGYKKVEDYLDKFHSFSEARIDYWYKQALSDMSIDELTERKPLLYLSQEKDPEFKLLLIEKVELEKEFVTIIDHQDIPAKLKIQLQKLMIQDRPITRAQKKNLRDLHPNPENPGKGYTKVEAYLEKFQNFRRTRKEHLLREVQSGKNVEEKESQLYLSQERSEKPKRKKSIQQRSALGQKGTQKITSKKKNDDAPASKMQKPRRRR